MMNPELKTQWLEALRSGRYQQTRGVLYRAKEEFVGGHVQKPGLCCLGVLYDVIDPEGCVEVTTAIKAFRNSQSTGYLPNDLAEEVGLGSLDIVLAGRNDRGDTFEQIADFIE